MPIQFKTDGGVMYSILTGRVTDEELFSHYNLPVFQKCSPPWIEIVDGREITDMAITPEGQNKLAAIAATKINQLRGGRVAMVASTDITYGMFRMWEVQRGDINYEVRVFREIEAALNWLLPLRVKIQKT